MVTKLIVVNDLYRIDYFFLTLASLANDSPAPVGDDDSVSQVAGSDTAVFRWVRLANSA